MDFKSYLNKKLYDFDGKLVMNDGPAGDGAFQNEDLYHIGKCAFEMIGEDPHTQNSNIAYDVNRGKLVITVVANDDIINRNKIDEFHSPYSCINEYFEHVVECVKEVCESIEGHTYLMDIEVTDIMSFDNQKKEQLNISIIKDKMDVPPEAEDFVSKDIDGIINSKDFGKNNKVDELKDFISKEVNKIINTKEFGENK